MIRLIVLVFLNLLCAIGTQLMFACLGIETDQPVTGHDVGNLIMVAAGVWVFRLLFFDGKEKSGDA